MVRFIHETGLSQSLKVGNWSSFANGYNGSNYHINKYDERLRGAFQRYTTGPLPDIRARQAQLILTYLGYDPGLVDGWFGPASFRALNLFRASQGRRETELLSEDDKSELWVKAFGTETASVQTVGLY
jgi:peptidoglycan hydrolase-like protein with peptidoglycan-binding domain